MAKKINTQYIADFTKLYNDFIDSDYIPDLEGFKMFLEENNFSTKHAEELFSYFQNPKDTKLVMDKKSLKFRKTNPKRDYFIKKVLIPTAITSAGIGAAAGAILSSGLIGGSTVLGIIPVSGTPGLTMMATATVGGLAGLASTPIVLKAKRALTNLHYKVWYKTAKKNLKEYENGVAIESLHITDLINKVQQTKKSILKTNHGSWFTAPFRFVKRHYLNTINRNRIHHIEAYTEDLVKKFRTIELNNIENKNAKLKSMYELLSQVDEFVSKDVLESKLYAMLTCKESNNKHIHRSLIENADIFSTLKIYIDAVSEADLNQTNKKSSKLKQTAKNLKNKNDKAAEIVNGDRLIARLVARYEAENQTEIKTEEQIVTNEKQSTTTLVVDEEVNKNNSQNNEDEITYSSNPEQLKLFDENYDENQLSIDSILNEQNDRPNLLVKTAQRLSYETRPITSSGEVIGTTLKIKSNNETEKVEIRYMKGNKQIRVKTTGSDNVVSQRFVPLTDTTIPPIGQMNDILRKVAEDKHIHNVEDLIIEL